MQALFAQNGKWALAKPDMQIAETSDTRQCMLRCAFECFDSPVVERNQRNCSRLATIFEIVLWGRDLARILQTFVVV